MEISLKDKLVYIKIKDLKKYEGNPKKHPEEQIQKIAESIKEFGFTIPIIIKDNQIIAGHGRVEAAKLLGIEEIPAIERNDLTEAQARAFRIADNKLAESSWDIKKLGIEIGGLKAINL